MATAEEKVQLRNPDPKKQMPRLPKSTYALARRTAFAVLPKKPPGMALEEFIDEMATRLQKAEGWDRSLSARWWAMAMKLDLEARGEIARINRRPPQRLVRT